MTIAPTYAESTGSLLDERQRREILERHQQLVQQGKLPSESQLDQECARFRARFGPQVLHGLDGEALLNLMHDINRDSLVYWLEFKNDEEFSTSKFGSIAGGSALKFRVFRRKETGRWQTGGERANQPIDISLEQAIDIARTHRSQLLAGVELLEKLPDRAPFEDYAALQQQMDQLAPDVSRLAWGHKYFSLLYPTKLDTYHSPEWQRFHLLKLLQQPPAGKGRYVGAGYFVAGAHEVGLPMVPFVSTLNARHGRFHRYWRVGTGDGKNDTGPWDLMRDRSCIAVGWPKLGDLSWVDGKSESNERLKRLLEQHYPNSPSAIGVYSKLLTRFVAAIAEGDIVVAAAGERVRAIGLVRGAYEHHPESSHPHRRPVEWLSTDMWELPDPQEGIHAIVNELGKSDENLLAIERQLQAHVGGGPQPHAQPAPAVRPVRLSGVPGRIQSILERKGQVILYGPPGTGKTYWAERSANDLAALSAFGKPFEALDPAERSVVVGQGANAGLVRLCCFHPAYGYEDFIEGYRPRTIDGRIAFELRPGVFKELCRDAAAAPDRNHYLIVDEINRGDIPRIFGELLTTLEKDKRCKRIILPVSQEIFAVPRNVFVLGTMNTADRSISLLDAALRRRFGFVELMPDADVLQDAVIAGIPLKAWLAALNKRIREHVGRDARNLQIGHSYLMHGGSPLKDVATLTRAVRDDIIPLLEEYCYEDFDALKAILGDRIVDREGQRIRHELFDDGQELTLAQVLLSNTPDISTSGEAIHAESQAAESSEPDDDEVES